jgi:hypothetical protein
MTPSHEAIEVNEAPVRCSALTGYMSETLGSTDVRRRHSQ